MGSGLTRRELGSRVAVLTALEKAVTAARREARLELDAMAMEAYEEDGVSGIDLLIGDEKVGKLSVPKPSVAVSGGDAFDEWAYERGRGRMILTVDIGSVPPNVRAMVNTILDQNSIPRYYEFKADDDATRGLEVHGGHVVDGNGEVVPGTYVKRPVPRVTGCKPADVGEAMRALGDSSTVAGLLTGGE